MSLFLTFLPFYLLGNLHCIGMCGPLVLLLGKNKYRYFYFFGRTLSFSLAGLIAGKLGWVLNLFFKQYQISFFTSLLFGSAILVIGLLNLFKVEVSINLNGALAGVNRSLSLLILKDKPLSTFLFGFFTLFLPCGQTLIVFSACAMSGDALTGFFNGLAFALLTSPSLFFAMQAHLFFKNIKPHYNKIMGLFAIFIGILSLLRAFAEAEWINHLVLNSQFHLILF